MLPHVLKTTFEFWEYSTKFNFHFSKRSEFYLFVSLQPDWGLQTQTLNSDSVVVFPLQAADVPEASLWSATKEVRFYFILLISNISEPDFTSYHQTFDKYDSDQTVQQVCSLKNINNKEMKRLPAYWSVSTYWHNVNEHVED